MADDDKTYNICVKCGKLPENKYMPLCKTCFDIENENQLLSVVILVSKKEGAKQERAHIVRKIRTKQRAYASISDKLVCIDILKEIERG
jgi:NMD protein affecting ribosome stability and mRNA decay